MEADLRFDDEEPANHDLDAPLFSFLFGPQAAGVAFASAHAP